MFRFFYQICHTTSDLPHASVRAKLWHRFLRSKRICSRKQGGFTALEMTVVLAIVAIMSSLAIPRLQGVSAQRNVDVMASEIAQQMEAARIYAQSHSVVVTGCPVNVADLSGFAPPTCLNLNNTANWSAWVWMAPVGVDGVNSIIMRSEAAPASVNMVSDRSTITFDRKGIANGSNLTIKVTSAQAQTPQQVVLASSGRITLSTNVMAPASNTTLASTTAAVLPTLTMDTSTTSSTSALSSSTVFTTESTPAVLLPAPPVGVSVTAAAAAPAQ
ncbi:hypothetical protein DTO96_101398 [Ephemeroptericola cinctiostellae]|uniref:Type II secretion system protein H n=1 Tax=Ephemeroptericola cinctiostellae TaxID=2268024 RepID=A0A345DBC9_9BURK|nr:GspH/FimT family pseudopilin [Ephemeroptericola cinctiostellae]AXF85667.1 hypothetical protein DTO96_101398 [Ephemeroptericola cinctiostellae]